MLPLRKKFIYIDLAIVLLCGLIVFYFVHLPQKIQKSSSQSAQPTPVQQLSSKIWQIAFTFHPQNQTLTVQSVAIKPGTATASPYTNSQYMLLVLDKNQHVLFKTGIPISEQVLYDIYFPPGATPSGLLQPNQLDSLITIPYFADAQTIQVTRSNQKILEFNPPKELSFHFPEFIKSAFAAANCDLLHIVFVSDGYANMTTFHSDAQKAEATFISKQPFASDTSIFDFKTVDNTIPLGCNQGGTLNVSCLYTNTSLSKISGTVFKAFPQLPQDTTHTKIVVLVDGAPQPMGGGLILGVANSLGGQFGVFQNRMFFESTATMEVLGHDVGQLYDRYLYPPTSGASQFGNTIPAPYASNCSTKPGGEAFWKSAGVTQGYKGCTSQYMYAPGPLDCPAGQGSHSTIMSAAGCAGTQFDGVEQYYIKSQILPNYCAAPSPTPSPTSTPTPTPSPRPTPTIPGATSATTQTTTNTQTSGTTSSVGSTPVPTKIQTFKCEPDPSCIANKSLGLCALKCTPQ